METSATLLEILVEADASVDELIADAQSLEDNIESDELEAATEDADPEKPTCFVCGRGVEKWRFSEGGC